MKRPTPPTAVSSESPRSSGWKRKLLAVVGLLAAVALLVGAWLVWRAGADPEHFAQHRRFLEETPAEQLTELAWEVERRVPGTWTRPIGSGDGVREVRVSFDELNAWLAVRADEVLANQGQAWPEQLGAVMLGEDGGRLVAAAEVDSGRWGPRVVSVFFEFTDDPGAGDDTDTEAQPAAGENQPADGSTSDAEPEDSGIGVRLLGANVGRQSLPRGPFLVALQGLPVGARHDRAQIVDRWSRQEAVTLPRLPVDAAREAIVEQVRLEPDGLTVRARAVFKR